MPTLTERASRAWDTLRGYKEAPAPKPTIGEIAMADPYWMFGGQGAFQVYNPSKLITAKGMDVIDQMRRDDQVKASLAFKKQAVLATGWEVSPAKGVDESDEATKFVTENFNALEGTLESSLLQVMSALDYGFSVSEKVYEERDGLIWLKAIKTKKPHPFQFKIDGFGNLISLIQQGNKELPPEKFLIYRHQPEFGNPYGVSDLDAAYRAWWSKDNAYKWLNMMLEKYGVPPIIAMYDPDAFKDGQLNTLKSVLSRLQAATAAMIPRRGKEQLDFYSPELAGQVSQVFTPALQMMNQDIARAILMPGFLGVTPDTQGSYARASIIFDMFMFAIDFLRKDLANAVNESIVQPLVALNFATDAPEFKFLPLTPDEERAYLELWLKMVGQGAVTKQEEDEIHIREKLDFPELTAEAAKRAEDNRQNPPPVAAPGAPPEEKPEEKPAPETKTNARRRKR